VIRSPEGKNSFTELLKRIGNLDRAYFWPLAIALVWLAIFLGRFPKQTVWRRGWISAPIY